MTDATRTHRRSFWIAAVAVLVLGLGTWLAFANRVAGDRPAGDRPTSAEDPVAATVQMTDDMRFVPGTVRIQAGATVTWRNAGTVPHTVTADPDRAADPGHVRLPDGVSPFDSGIIGAGESYTRTFEVAGTYKYFCIPHEGQGMVGTIIVG